jgi:hypothetical protein
MEIERASLDAYAAFRQSATGRALYAEFVRIALELRQSGWRSYTAQGICEHVRMRVALKRGPQAGLKVNNNYVAFLAREAMATEPRLKGMFETRRSKADLS